jgi:hypothetical protein
LGERESDREIRRTEIHPHDISGNERTYGVRSKREGLDSSRSRSGLGPESTYRRVTEPKAPSDLPRTRSVRRDAERAGGRAENLLHPDVRDTAAAGRSHERSFDPPKAVGQEPVPPASYGQSVDPEPLADREILIAVGGGQHDAGA